MKKRDIRKQKFLSGLERKRGKLSTPETIFAMEIFDYIEKCIEVSIDRLFREP